MVPRNEVTHDSTAPEHPRQRRGDAETCSTSSVVLLRPLFAFAAAQHVDVDAILATIGLARSALEDRRRRIPEACKHRAWRLVAERGAGSSLGIEVARRAEIGEFDVLDYLILLSNTLQEGVQRAGRFHRILSDDLGFRLELDRDTARVCRDWSPSSWESECFCATVVLRARKAIGDNVCPVEVRFSHPAPKDPAVYRSFFGCPVRFASAATEVVFHASDFRLPVRTAQPRLMDILEGYLVDHLDQLPKSDLFLDVIRAFIGKNLHRGRPSLREIAEHLHASPRTVQRRLQAHGTSLQAVVESVRREAAEPLVEEGHMSIKEIAFLSGFAEAGAFREAYKRWTGLLPSQRRLKG